MTLGRLGRGGWLLKKIIGDPRLEYFLVIGVIAFGLSFRWAHLDADGFWVDEAESAINALTILQHGYPADNYLGLPIYENTLIQPWPENPEYEFRDVSYSDKGVAVYHGWLPLYAMAASFALHHIQPDEHRASTAFKYGVEEWKRRTYAARLPSVLFGGLFLALAFLGGRTLYGSDAGWIALLSLVVHPWNVAITRQARYYSATIAISTACCLMVWRMFAKRTWLDFLIGAFMFVLLFHTHLLSFVVACAMFGAMLPVILYRNPGDFAKIAAFGSIIAAGTIPWIFLTDFYRHQSRIPRGWSLLSLPRDLILFPPAKPMMLGVPSLFLLLVLLAWASSWFSARRKAILLDSLPPILFLTAWGAFGYIVFLFFMPAASFARVNMSYWGPVSLIIPVIVASVLRFATASPLRDSPPAVLTAGEVRAAGISYRGFPARDGLVPWLAVTAGLVLMFQSSLRRDPHRGTSWQDIEQMANTLRAMKLRTDTKFYASPNNHLVLSFYTGLPVQSIASVRKSFLDRYPGDIVIVQRGIFDPYLEALTPDQLQTEAVRTGKRLSETDAESLSAMLRTHDYRQAIIGTVTGAPASLEEVPSFARAAFLQFREESRASISRPEWSLDLMTRGFDVETFSDWGDVFFYRFVDPFSRVGPNRNYAARLRGAKGFILAQSGTVIYLSPGRSHRAGMGIDFSVVASTAEFHSNKNLDRNRHTLDSVNR